MPSKVAIAIQKTVEQLERSAKVKAATEAVAKTLTEAHRLAALKIEGKR